MTASGVEIMVLSGESEEAKPTPVEFCEQHDSELRFALVERGLGEDLELTEIQRDARAAAGKMDSYTLAKQNMTLGAAQFLGACRIEQSGGCPACAFMRIVECAADGAASVRRRN